MKILNLTKESKEELLRTLAERSTESFQKQQDAVDAIVRDVKANGDEAVFAYTQKFDGVTLTPDNIWVTQEEIDAAYKAIDPELLTVIRESAANVRAFHERQRRNSWFDTKDGIILGQRVTPISKVGVYVPGGRAVLSSSVLMNIIPAKVAGVPEIVMVTPPQKDGELNAASVVAAVEAGVTKIAKVGGAQAIAALAYGTKSIPRVDKIVGPGNIYVALAKKAVYGSVGRTERDFGACRRDGDASLCRCRSVEPGRARRDGFRNPCNHEPRARGEGGCRGCRDDAEAFPQGHDREVA